MSTVIETERLILRPLRRQDLGDLVRVLNNFNVSRMTARIPYPYVLKDAEEFFELAQKQEPGTLRLSITRRHEPGVIGGISYEAGEATELGYWLAEPCWGKGYGTEAAHAMTGHAFDTAGHDRLLAGYRLGNEASRRILEGLGFIRTGEIMMFSRAVGAETKVARLELTRENWRKAKERRR